MAQISAKLSENVFQTIPDVLFVDAKTKFATCSDQHVLSKSFESAVSRQRFLIKNAQSTVSKQKPLSNSFQAMLVKQTFQSAVSEQTLQNFR